MTIFYLTIPLMLVAIGFAVIPLLWAMKHQVDSEGRVPIVVGGHGSPSARETVQPQWSDTRHPSAEVRDLAA